LTVDTWDESLETGNELIDNQHRALIALSDELQRSESGSREQMILALDKIVEFAQSHFLMEEELMAGVGYPDDAAHLMIEEHREFKSYARLRILEFRHGEGKSIKSLHMFMDDYLKKHEFGTDRDLADWIQQQKL
jgi:hemerythrin